MEIQAWGEGALLILSCPFFLLMPFMIFFLNSYLIGFYAEEKIVN
jgi:hypothetical protein